jgi:hypothetical protein
MKQHKIIFTILSIIIMLTISCEDFLDVNYPPGSPGPDAINESVVLPTLLACWYGDNAAQEEQAARYWTLQSVLDAPTAYSTWTMDVNSLVTYAQWSPMMNTLKNAVDVRRLAIENGNKNYQGIAEVLMAWGWANLTDYFGEVPYSQAFKFPEIVYPEYDTQQIIYAEVENLLNSAIANLSDNSPQKKPSKDDLVNQGNISKWIKFAYGLKARYAMRLSYAPGKTKSNQAQIAIAALSKSLSSNNDNIDFEHYDITGQRGWVYEYQKNLDFSWTPSIFIIDMLKNLNDPRLERIFDPAYTGEYYGWKSGTASTVGMEPSRVSRTKYLDPAAPTVLMAYAECKFVEAEAQLFVGNLPGANLAFKAGIRADLERLGIAQADIDAYIATLTLPNNEEAAQEMIINQKYLANFMGTCEPEFDHVRTGYPKFDYPANMNDVGSRTMPRKLPHPEMEKVTNKNCPTYIGTPQSPQNRVWWDTKVVLK